MNDTFPIKHFVKPRVDKFDPSDHTRGIYSIEKIVQTIAAESSKQFDDLVFSDIFKMLPPEVTDVVLVDKQYIIEAIREKMDREGRRNV